MNCCFRRKNPKDIIIIYVIRFLPDYLNLEPSEQRNGNRQLIPKKTSVSGDSPSPRRGTAAKERERKLYGHVSEPSAFVLSTVLFY